MNIAILRAELAFTSRNHLLMEPSQGKFGRRQFDRNEMPDDLVLRLIEAYRHCYPDSSISPDLLCTEAPQGFLFPRHSGQRHMALEVHPVSVANMVGWIQASGWQLVQMSQSGDEQHQVMLETYVFCRGSV